MRDVGQIDAPDQKSPAGEPPKTRGRQLGRAIVSGWAGTSLEYFDFQLYGLAAALVLPTLFFPGLNPAVGLLSSFATYAVGFLARPLGAVVFGRIGDKHGRKPVLVITVALMGVSTFGIGLLPTYAQVGIWAPILLVTLRLLQGFGAGAELAGTSVLLAEYAPGPKRGAIASFVALGTNTGTLVASGVWLLIANMPSDSMLSWGWRVPFILSIFVVIAALVIRRYLDETPVFEAVALEEPAEERAPLRDAWVRGKKPFLAAIGIRVAESGPSSIFHSFLLGYIATVLVMDRAIGTQAVFLASLVGFVTVPLAGWLSDRFGRRIVYMTIAGFQFLWAVPTMLLLNSGKPALMTLAIVVGISVGVLGLYSVQGSYMPELFGSRYRYSGMAVAKEIGSIISGGLAPMIASALLAVFTNSWIPIAAYLLVTSAIGVVTAYITPETAGRDLTDPADAL
ncbi:MFS transporter [Rhodococcus sp. NPDC057014]|uniref:MFS transporter n=1 Tax=Rhodococcus sp. NPDC057014 TaxID=3346000 RepID=UPI003626CD4B